MVKCSFKVHFEEFQGEKSSIFLLFFLVVDEAFFEVPLFQEISPAPKNFWLRVYFLVQLLLTTVHPFLYLHIGF